MNSRLYTIVLTALMIMVPFSWADNAKMGFIDMERVMVSRVIKGKFSALEQEFEGRQKDFEATKSRLYQMNEDLKRDAATMTQAMRESREVEVRDMWNKLQQQGSEIQAEYARRHQGVQEAVMKQVLNIAEKQAKRLNLDVVHKLQAVAYIKPENDLTDEIIRNLK